MLTPRHMPRTIDDLRDIVADAHAQGSRLEISGGGSKANFGAPRENVAVLSMAALAGIVDYDAPELVLTAWAGTRLADIAALVAEHGQMLAFEPFDHGPIYGRPQGAATIGGVIAAGVAGSARVSAGGARDHLLGFTAISGQGEIFVGGAKVVKNVTGYDLPKVMAGSWGRLAALAQVTLKVLPRPRTRQTLILENLSPAQARLAMAQAMGSQADPAAVAHVPATFHRRATTAFRLQGVGPSVIARAAMLRSVLADHGAIIPLEESQADTVWASIRDLTGLAAERPLWRINVAPAQAPSIAAILDRQGADWLFDWAGGLIWAATDAPPLTMRALAEAAGGHATLVRAPASLRASTPALHPPPPALARLERRVRQAFDPAGTYETRRFLDGTDAD